LHLLDGCLRALKVVKDHEGLALGLEVLLRYDVDYISKFLKNGPERIGQCVGLDALFEILYVDPKM
jgi:hypothetical protein